MNKYYGPESVSDPEIEKRLQDLQSLETKLEDMLKTLPHGKISKREKIESLLFRIPMIAMHLKDGLPGRDLKELSREVADLKK